MTRFQFSLRHLLIAVALFALYGAGVINNVYVLADLAFTATVFILLTSLLGVIYRRDELRSYWVGFAVFGWGYSVLAFGPVGESSDHLITSFLVGLEYHFIIDESLGGEPPFLRLGHCIAAIMFAVVGGLLGRRFFTTAHSPNS